jgi:hypothetical protein
MTRLQLPTVYHLGIASSKPLGLWMSSILRLAPKQATAATIATYSSVEYATWFGNVCVCVCVCVCGRPAVDATFRADASLAI